MTDPTTMLTAFNVFYFLFCAALAFIITTTGAAMWWVIKRIVKWTRPSFRSPSTDRRSR